MKPTELFRLVIAVATIALGMTAYSLLIALQTVAS
jgi:hypothetical protein